MLPFLMELGSFHGTQYFSSHDKTSFSQIYSVASKPSTLAATWSLLGHIRKYKGLNPGFIYQGYGLSIRNF